MADSEIQIVREDDPRCAELEAAGYTVVGLSWGGHLRLSEPPDLTRMTKAITDAAGRGFTCVELTDSDAQLISVVDNASATDYPFTPATRHDAPTSESIATAFASGTRFWGGLIESRLVAVTGVEPKGERWNTAFTSVLPAHRHLGFGTALKATSIVALAHEGVRWFSTGGAASNDASLAANLRLGYVLEPRWRSYALV